MNHDDGWYLQDTHQEKLSFSAVSPADVHIRGLNIRVTQTSWLKRRKTAPDVEADALHKRILTDIDADFPRATLTGIIGSSGSGKTTLLNVLAHRMKSSNLKITGQLLYNNDAALSSVTHAYVTQTDVLLPTLTVRETLKCAADLRLPGSVSAAQRAQLVEEIILELGLKECADTAVGDGHRRRGCSGGERRRVSLAVQMLGNPSVLFLDEPTTGLDATSAYQLVRTLQSIASKGRTVIMTLHQPRSEVFFMLDRIALLAKGSMLYAGQRDGAVPWFESRSPAKLQLHVNPAEYLIGLGTSKEESNTLTIKWKESASERFPPIKQEHEADIAELDVPHEGKAPIQRTVWTLVSRTFRTSFRDPMGLTTSWIEAALMGLVVGLVFLQLPETLAGIRSRQAAVYISVGLQGYLMVMFEVYRLVVIEMPVFDREHSEGVVGVVPWVLSYRISHLFLEDIIVPFIFAVISYWTMGLAKDVTRFAIYFVVVFLSQITSVTFAGLAASVSRDFGAVTLMANLAYTVHTFGCGFFLQADRIPIWLRWIKWVSQLFYGFTALIYNEFKDRFYACPATPSSPQNPACIAYTGEFIINSLAVPRIKGSWRTVPLLAMLGFALVYLALTMLLLHVKKVDITMLGQKKKKEIQGDSVREQTDKKEKLVESVVKRGINVSLVGYTLRIKTRGLGALWGHSAASKEKTILDGISTTFEAGKVNVILGPSGSGKSSLLNLMAQRLQSSWKTNYAAEGSMVPSLPPGLCSYVTQDDAALLPYLTVRETLHFAAALRQVSVSKAEEVLARMGLGNCADTLVGGESSEGGLKGKGISGGEKRRVSIAVQVLTEPGVLILDEPTSGLDASTALSIMSVLVSLAQIEGRTIITTLHQSSSSLFAAFDNVLLLSKGTGEGGGKVIYAGTAKEMLPYLERAGWACPREMNPADFALDVVSVDLREVGREEESRVRVGGLVRKWEESVLDEKGKSESGPDEHWTENKMAPMGISLPILLHRGWLAFKRQKTLPEARVGNVLGLGIVSAVFFSPLGHDYVSVQNRIGCLQEILPLYFVGMLQNLAVYPMERDIFYREYADGAYSLESFFVSYTILELPCEVISCLLFSLLVGIATDLTRSVAFFLILTLNALCIVNAGESLGIIFNTLLRDNTGLALNVTNVILSVSTFMAGLMSVDQPGFFKALNKLSPLGYAVANLTPYSFRGQVFTCGADERLPDGSCVISSGEDVLAIYKFEGINAPLNLAAIVITAVVLRLLAYAFLKARKTSWK